MIKTELKIEKSVIDNGILFVWSEKEYLSDLI